jgi:alkylation response protein AidB-like acyl-CoA dehydrogenase
MQDAAAVKAALAGVAADFATEHAARAARTHLERDDFDRLRDAGFQRLVLPASMGGLWRGVRASTRDVAEAIAVVAGGNASVALVAAMHPAVLAYFLLATEAGAGAGPAVADAWHRQFAQVFEGVRAGHWWATANSEPGSGGDLAATRATARPAAEGGWRLSGDKHFVSGAGIADFMITSALPGGETTPATFHVAMRDVAWDGSSGLTLVRAWDGIGMRATQSHAFRFDDYPAVRLASPVAGRDVRLVAGPVLSPFIACLFTALAVGIVRVAVRWLRARSRRGGEHPLAASERVRVENAAWLLEQAHAGMLAAVERGDADAAVACLRGKFVIAELAEALLLRAQRIQGGSSYAASSPLGRWFDDVRALGFLRPPWPLAHVQLAQAATAG